MSFFTPERTAEAVAETSGSYFNKSGIYDIKLKIVSVDISKNGATGLNFNIEYNGAPSTIYGMWIKDRNDKPTFAMKTFNNLCIVSGIDNVSDPEEQEHLVGKDKTPKNLLVLDDFTDLEVKVRVQEEYSKYEGNISKRLVIKNFYTIDGASASEIVNGTEVGAQLEKDKAYADNITYKDVTPEEVQAWKDSFKEANAGGGATAKPAASKPAGGSLFK